MNRKYLPFATLLALIIVAYYFFNRSGQVFPEDAGTTFSNTKVSTDICLQFAALSAESIQSLDPTKQLRASENVVQLPDIKSGESTGFWVLLIDETTGLIGGLSTCVLDEGELVSYDATAFEIPVDTYPPISAESLVKRLAENGTKLQPNSIPRLVFVDRRYLSTPIYEVSLLSGKKAFYSGIDGNVLKIF